MGDIAVKIENKMFVITPAFTPERIASTRGRISALVEWGLSEQHDVVSLACITLPAALDEIERLSAERDAWKGNAVACGKMLQSFTPGGSEYFSKRIGDDHFATDEKACGAIIRSKLDALHKAKCEVVSATRELSRVKAERDEAMAVLTKLAMFDDVGPSEQLAKSGSYAGFDEPGSVETARSFLSRMEGRKDG